MIENVRSYFLLDLDKSKQCLEVLEYTEEVLKDDMDFFGCKDPLELNDYDFKVFDSEKKADSYLKKYEKILSSLNNAKICNSRSLPAMLYKRRYIVQTLMNEKLQTYRHYCKNWKKGDLFNLHDQTYFLTVQLISIEKVNDEMYKYKFKLP